MKQIRIFYLLLIIVSANSNAQINTFEKCFNYGNTENGFSVRETFDHGFIIAGRDGISLTYSRLLLIKTDSLGNQQWVKFISNNSWEHEGHDIQQTPDSGYIICGLAEEVSSGANLYIVKTDKNGDTLWTKNFGSTKYDIGYSVVSSLDGGYYVAGSYNDSLAIILKVDNFGDTIWTKKFIPAGAEAAAFKCVQQLKDSSLLLSGVGVFPSGDYGSYVVKLSATGDSVWTKCFLDRNSATYIDTASNTNYILTGYKSVYTSGNGLYLMRLNSNGDSIWTRTFSGSGVYDCNGYAVHELKNGDITVFGSFREAGSVSRDFWLIKTDNAGNNVWSKLIGTIEEDYAYDMQITHDSGFIMVGSTICQNVGGAYVVKVDSGGNIVNSVEYLNYEISEAVVSPNPFFNSTIINLAEASYGSVTVEVYDLSGKLVKVLIEEISDNSVTINRDGLEDGAYLFIANSETNRKVRGKFIIFSP